MHEMNGSYGKQQILMVKVVVAKFNCLMSLALSARLGMLSPRKFSNMVLKLHYAMDMIRLDNFHNLKKRPMMKMA